MNNQQAPSNYISFFFFQIHSVETPMETDSTTSTLVPSSTTAVIVQQPQHIHISSGGEDINGDHLAVAAAQITGGSQQLQVQYITAPASQNHGQQQDDGSHVLRHQQLNTPHVQTTTTLVELSGTDATVVDASNGGAGSVISGLGNVTWRTVPAQQSHNPVTTLYETPLTSATNTMLEIHSVEDGVPGQTIVYDPNYRHDGG